MLLVASVRSTASSETMAQTLFLVNTVFIIWVCVCVCVCVCVWVLSVRLSVTEVSLIREKNNAVNAAEEVHYHKWLRRAFVGASAYWCVWGNEQVSWWKHVCMCACVHVCVWPWESVSDRPAVSWSLLRCAVFGEGQLLQPLIWKNKGLIKRRDERKREGK